VGALAGGSCGFSAAIDGTPIEQKMRKTKRANEGTQ
jgi:hypothetical protein